MADTEKKVTQIDASNERSYGDVSRKYIIITVIAGLLLCALSYHLIKQYSIGQVEKRVRDSMLECRAFHEYVQHNMHPEYYKLMQDGRLPQGFYAPEILSSSYIARTFQQHYNDLRRDAGLPEIIYKMAASNPRNPINKASKFEDSLIEMFNKDRNKKSFNQVVNENGVKYLLSARPFLAVEQSCLKCHGRSEDAPQQLSNTYNWQGGFNLKIGDIVAIETVRSPLKGEFNEVMLQMVIIAVVVVIVMLLLLFNKRLQGLVNQKTKLLAESEELYRSIAEDTPVLLCRSTPEMIITYVNGVFSTYFGKTPEKLVGTSILSLMSEDESRLACGELKKLTYDKQINIAENHVIRSDGSERLLHWTTRAVFDTRKKLLAYQAIGEDISEMREMQNTIDQERERLSVSLRSIGDGVITINVDGRVELVNRVAEKLTGWKMEEAKGKPFGEIFRIINRVSRKPCRDPIDKILSSGEIIELEDDTLLVARDGTERLIADSGAPIRDRKSLVVGVVLVFRDITEKCQMQEVMNRTAKLNSLAVLAGGIAHDFNNLLGGIYGYTDMALEKTKDEPVRKDLEKSLATIDRARGLTQQLITFAKGGEPVKKTDALFPFIEENARFAMSGSAISLTCTVQDDLWMCDYDHNQLAQVIDNLVINAIQAMNGSGTISISACNVVLQKNTKSVLESGNYVKVSLHDTGCGIPSSIIEKIFDPFFTTKDKGYGLGLSTCNSIVLRHGGCIEVESQEGVGTTIHLYFPASISEKKKASTCMVTHKLGQGIFYVMDDEEIVRTAIAAMLQALGYEVIQCETGEEVVASFSSKTDKESVAGFIFDLTVRGGIGGEETLRRIRTIDKTKPVFVTSGYSEDPIMAEPQSYGFVASIRKPFIKSELVEMLKSCLGDNSEG